jgi:hypothetical protein
MKRIGIARTARSRSCKVLHIIREWPAVNGRDYSPDNAGQEEAKLL